MVKGTQDEGIISKSFLPTSKLQGLWQAILLDIPWVLDSAWRRLEFSACRSGTLALDGTGEFKPRALVASPVAALFLVTSVFFVFGPTLDSLCTAIGVEGFVTVRKIVGALLLIGSAIALWFVFGECKQRLDGRRDALLNDNKGISATARAALPWRFGLATALIGVGAVLSVSLPFFLALYQANDDFGRLSCVPGANVGASRGQIVVWIACAAAGLWIISRRNLFRKPVSAFGTLWLLLALFVLTLLALGGVRYFLAKVPTSEAEGGPYLQFFVPIVITLLAIAAVARLLALWCFGSAEREIGTNVKAALPHAHIMSNDRADPPITRIRVFAAFLIGLGYHLLHLLLMPAMAALFAPSNLLWMLVSVVFVFAVLFVVWGSLSRRWHQLLLYLRRWFLIGTPLVVSVGVIAIGVLRLLDVQYVSTILDATPFGTLFMLVIGAYSVLWFAEYWFNRWPAEYLMCLLGARAPADGHPYAEPLILVGDAAKDVAGQGQVLALHGTGQIAVHGWYWDERQARGVDRIRGWSTYGFEEFFDALCVGRDQEPKFDVRRRVRLYFSVLNLLIIATVVTFLFLKDNWNRPLSQLKVVAADAAAVAPSAVDLADLLVRQARAQRPAIIVAASGGGTRAAVYSVEALQGLQRLGHAKDIVLASGVSGGGVALTYFASRFDELTATDTDSSAVWTQFRETMKQPFIRDVLEGAAEFRILQAEPLGILLAESFERRIFTTKVKNFGDLRGPPIILNTTISGHPLHASELLRGRVGAKAEEGDECLKQSRPYASLSGGRLLFTNLTSPRNPFPDNTSVYPDVRLPYVAVRDPTVPLSVAAALNANFPPVFPNARVRLDNSPESDCKKVSYFVTDGGATENLGLISALYALREALPRAQATLAASGEQLPTIDVVAIEASAVTYDYEQDRGVGAAVGGSKERVAGGLTQELLDQLIRAHCPGECASLKFHYLPLPLAFRSRGGFGTHWMFARSIRVSNPHIAEARGRIEQWWRQKLGEPHYEILDVADVEAVWSALYAKKPDFCAGAWTNQDPQRVRLANWMCGRDETGKPIGEQDYQIAAWETLVRQLGSPRNTQ